MTIVVPVPIAPGPAVPDSGQSEPIFDAQYEAFNTWERNVAAPGMNALADAAYQNALDANAKATAATTKAAEAASSATAAAGSATTAGTKAGEASASAAAAAGSATTAGTKAGEASASATAALAFASTANTKAGEASASAAAALASRNQAEVFATQQLKASSTTSLTPGLGSKTFTIETGRSFVAGMYLVATSSGVPSSFMRGAVVSYDGATGALVLDVDGFSGAAARADWVLGVAAVGAADPASAIHAAASKATPVDADELGLVDSAATWGLKKLTWANLKATLLAYFQGQFRERLSAARTYYVRADGNDANTGLANTAGGAFLTLQKAVDVVTGTLDLGIYNVTIQIADGTYTVPTALKPYVSGGGRPTIQGNVATPANVLISTTNNNCFIGVNAGWWTLNGVKLQTTTAGRGIFLTGHGSQLDYLNVNFGACVNEHMLINIGAAIRALGPWSISGSAPSHVNPTAQGYFAAAAVTCTLTGTPAFSYFVDCDMNSVAIVQSVTFSGSATGGRYRVLTNGVVQTYGGGASYLPGNAAGTVDGTGVYA